VLDIHGKDYGLGGDLSEDEITVIRGALDLSNKTATSCMTPLDKVLLDMATVQRLFLRMFLECGEAVWGLEMIWCTLSWLLQGAASLGVLTCLLPPE
jgi:hypothetical protein